MCESMKKKQGTCNRRNRTAPLDARTLNDEGKAAS